MSKIFLSVPVLDRPELQSLYSIYQSVLSCTEHKVRIYFNEDDSLISRVRNNHITKFLNEYKDCDYFMSIDSDIEIVNAFPNNNIFSKLISHDLDFVGGLYALRDDQQKRCASIPLNLDISLEDVRFDSGLVEMRWLSSGCWCLKRSVVERMAEAYPELIYSGENDMSEKMINGLYIPDIFEIENSDGIKFKKYLSEDWAFAERWRNIGGKIFADTSIGLNHIGKTKYKMWDLEINQNNDFEKQNKKNEPPLAGWDLI